MNELLIKDIVIQLRQNNITNDTEISLKEIIGGMNHLVSQLQGKNGIDMNQVVCRIRDLLDAYQSGDIIYLADVLEYEILDLINCCS